MFPRALICTDLTEDSDRLIACADSLQELGVREAVLAHVVDAFGTAQTGGAVLDRDFERQSHALESSGLRVTVDLPVGHPTFALLEAAREHDTSLTVVAAAGKGLSDAAFSGSTSSDLIMMSENPVLVIAPDSLSENSNGARAGGRLLEHALFATDFSESSLRAFDVLLAMAPRVGSVTLMHVQDVRLYRRHATPGQMAEHDGTDQERLDAMRAQLEDHGVAEVETLLICGLPAERTVRRAIDGKHSIVIVGIHGRTDGKSVLGGVNDALLRGGPPVLLMP